jgi:hypothetical protein
MLILAATLAGVASAFYAKRQHFDFWGSPEMLVAYVCAALAVLFFYFAVSGTPFPPWAAPYEPPKTFPDVEVEITKSGKANVPHPNPLASSRTVNVALYGLRLVNHEPQRAAVITVRLFQDLNLEDGAAPEVVCSRFQGDHPEVHLRRVNILDMPVNVAPGASIAGDLIFELNAWGGKSAELPIRLELEDHLSGAKVSMQPRLGSYGAREAKA